MHLFIETTSGQDSVSISGDDFVHTIQANRYRLGDKLTLIPLSNDFVIEGEVESISKKSFSVKPLHIHPKPPRPKTELTLFPAILKKEKMEWMLQKIVELGVSTITPIITSRCIAKADEHSINRWEKIIREAAMQSRRYYIPEIHTPIRLENCSFCENTFCLFEKEKGPSLKSALNQFTDTPSGIGIIIGPEGGFSDLEIERLREKDIDSVSFGSSILRAETASIAAISVLRYNFL